MFRAHLVNSCALISLEPHMNIHRTTKNLLLDFAKHTLPSFALLLILFEFTVDNVFAQSLFLFVLANFVLSFSLMSKPIIIIEDETILIYADSTIVPTRIRYIEILNYDYSDNCLLILIKGKTNRSKVYAEISGKNLTLLWSRIELARSI